MKKKKLLWIIALIIILVAFGVFNWPIISRFLTGEKSVNFEVVDNKAYMNGYINSDTPEKVLKLIEEHPNIKTIVMENVPGSIDDDANLLACRIVRDNNFNTYIPSDGEVDSGGVDFFIAGVKRTIGKGAKLGVHSWASVGMNDASKLSKDDERHQLYIKYYEEMQLPKPEEFYFFTINITKSDDIHYMNLEEITKYRVATDITI